MYSFLELTWPSISSWRHGIIISMHNMSPVKLWIAGLSTTLPDHVSTKSLYYYIAINNMWISTALTEMVPFQKLKMTLK
jgi:hypothetical protein